MYVFIEALQSTFLAGGSVMLPIILTGVIGFYYLYSTWMRIGGDAFRKDVYMVVEMLRNDLNIRAEDPLRFASKHLGLRGGIVSRELRLALNVAKDTPEKYREYMQVRMIKTVQYMRQGTHIISVMAAAAPLLGLLGTVTGMVSTFEVITLYGNQNPVLMADGISEALISTQSGLLVAFPLTLLKQRLDERIEYLTEQLELGATIIENYMSLQATPKAT
ncbi:MotA/TolQ/ExbB proton channel family protein [Hallerella succinigenes]|uniref:MotA/TolQ/ExbB proton channel family protein n=1 Tax=Hallerella succinigenes TaxID=1896222 RepID=UPI000D0DE6FA|nr:MotA/TolQ/ExbB proton channel family protein [Hallerella succinigenes]MDY5029108.1 MotA/TolQ/ExbB proton channel family protein [Hallerella succinigenes]